MNKLTSNMFANAPNAAGVTGPIEVLVMIAPSPTEIIPEIYCWRHVPMPSITAGFQSSISVNPERFKLCFHVNFDVASGTLETTC